MFLHLISYHVEKLKPLILYLKARVSTSL